jgi:hypothetical protein
MVTTIYKYNIPEHSPFYGVRDNYFDSQISFKDKFVMRRHLYNAFPMFREEWQLDDDVNVLKSGYFDMKCSLIMSERSQLGLTLEEFFENLSGNNARYKYLVVCETGNVKRSYCGFIDVATLTADKTPQRGQYSLSFSVTGIDKEVVDRMKYLPIGTVDYDMTFETQYLEYEMYNMLGIKLLLDSRLDIAGKINMELVVDRFTHNNFLDANVGYKLWNTFKSFMIAYGFRFKVLFTGVVHLSSFPQFKLVLFFPSEGLNNVTITKFIEYQAALNKTGTKYVMMFFTDRPDGGNENITQYTGMIMSREYVWISNSIQSDRRYDNYTIVGQVSVSGADTKTIIELERLKDMPVQIFENNTAISRCVRNEGYTELLRYAANTQYGKLLEGLKKARKLTLKVPNDSSLTLGSQATIEDNSYTLERINSFNDFTKTMETEWTEL